MTTCRKCGAYWTGHKIEHCGDGCHQTFAATKSGDAHRTGDHEAPEGTPDARRCRTPEEMRVGGMWTTASPTGTEIWHGHVSKSGKQNRKSPTGASPGPSQDGEQGQAGTQGPPDSAVAQNRARRLLEGGAA